MRSEEQKGMSFPRGNNAVMNVAAVAHAVENGRDFGSFATILAGRERPEPRARIGSPRLRLPASI